MKPGDRTKTVVIDLNVVENPSRFEPIVHRVRREGGYIMLTESHLSELFKDAQTWRVALAKHCVALCPAVDLIVIPRQTCASSPERIDESNGRWSRAGRYYCGFVGVLG